MNARDLFDPKLKTVDGMPMTKKVSVVEEGRNYFRVEAQLTEDTGRLRPGMAGIGKVAVGERQLIWIWTHTFVDWLRLELWAWWP